MMIAGEASGDQIGADLAAQILAVAPAAELAGGLRPILRAFTTLRRALRHERPDLVVPIDYPDFNLKLAWCARRAGVRVLYYVAPQVWAWRRWRIRTLTRRSDHLAVVLPFEAELYRQAGGKVTFVGHPLLDRVKPAQDRAATLARHGLPPRARLLALL